MKITVTKQLKRNKLIGRMPIMKDKKIYLTRLSKSLVSSEETLYVKSNVQNRFVKSQF